MHANKTEEENRALFESELQQFARDVEILCALEAGGKVDPKEAYKKIKQSWKTLKSQKKELLPKKNKPAASQPQI